MPGLAYFRFCFQPVWTSFNRLGLTCKHYQPKFYFLAGRYSPCYRSRNSATHYNNFDFMRGLFYYLLLVCFLLNEITFRSRRSSYFRQNWFMIGRRHPACACAYFSRNLPCYDVIGLASHLGLTSLNETRTEIIKKDTANRSTFVFVFRHVNHLFSQKD